ncbi:MAG: hypothetical protein LBE17_04970 [Treponema sp.]|jgi:hypothetical protein|nr:hypothetical protein [Treponema sp.]
MKKFFLLCCLSLAGVFPLLAEIRFDLGMDMLFVQATERRRDDATLLDGSFFPIPEVGLYGQFNFGNIHAGLGLRGFSYLFYSALWPALYGEYDLGPVTFHAQLGGGLFAVINLLGGNPEVLEDYEQDSTVEIDSASSFMVKANPSIVPEISVWYRFGKFCRVGAGWVTLFVLNPAAGKMFDINPQFYVALKMIFPSAASRKRPDGSQRLF